MTDPLFLGIDLGTTRLKAGVYDSLGNQHGFALLESASPETWWEICRQAIRECLKEVDVSRVSGVCVGGQGPTLVAVDHEGRLIRPAIPYDDCRAAPEAAAISNQLGRQVSVRSSYLPRALWIRNHELDIYAATHWFLQAWDYVAYRLTGAAAATSPMGIYTPWSESDIAAVGLDPERFPPLVKTGDLVTGVSKDASAETGLPLGTPVVAGGGDFLLGTMGVAGARKGLAQSQGGTTGAFTLCWDRPLEGGMIGWCIPSPIQPELFNAGGPLTTGGAALDWLLRSVLKLPANYDAALSDAARIPPCGDGLLFFPYLAGEQLTMAPEIRSLFLGLSLHHDANHLIRAVLEGVAFAGRSILDSLVAAGGRVDEVVTYGGQARSALWNQIKANVWSRPVFTPKVLDAGCLGAAAISAVGVGVHPSLSAASEQMAQAGCVYLPDADQVSIYDDAYLVYREIYPRTDDLFVSLSSLRQDS